MALKTFAILKIFKEGLLLGLLLLLPIIFNPYSGDVELSKLTILSAMSILLGSITIAAGKIDKLKAHQPLLQKSLLILLLSCVVVTILAYDPWLSLWGSKYRFFGLWTWLMGILLILSTSQILNTKASYVRLLKTISISGLLASIGAILVQMFYDTSYFDYRFTGTLGNPNVLGKILLISIIPSIYLAISEKSKSWFWALLAIFQGFCLWGTGNRAAWVALLIVALIYSAKATKHHLKVLSVTGLIATIIGTLSWSRIMSLQSIQTRLELYWAGIKAIVRNPIYGYGFDQTEGFLDLPNFTLAPDRTHQLFIDATLNLGIFGAAAFAVLTIGSLFVLLKSKDKNLKVLGASFLALLISLQASFLTIATFAPFCVFIGLALGVQHKKA